MENLGSSSLAQHLESRHFDLHTHKAWLSDDVASFPIWNLSGQLVGYQQYRPYADKACKNDPRDGRYFTRLARERVGVWGLESWTFSRTLFVCEGVFDACKISWLGFSSLALFSNQVNASTASWLEMVRQQRPVVALCDSDSSGLGLARYAHYHYQFTDWHDVGEAPVSAVLDLCLQFNED